MIRNISLDIVRSTNYKQEDAFRILRDVSKACRSGANVMLSLLLGKDKPAFESVKWSSDGKQFSVKKNGKLDIPKMEKNREDTLYNYFINNFSFVSTHVATYIVQSVEKKYFDSRFNILIGKESSPSYKSFPIITDSWDIEKGNDNEFIISVALLSKKSNLIPRDQKIPERVNFLLNTRKTKNTRYGEIIQKLISGDIKKKTISIVYKKKKNKWRVNICCDIDQCSSFKPKIGRNFHVYTGKQCFVNLECEDNGQSLWTDCIDASQMGFYDAYKGRLKNISRKYRQDRSADTKPGSVGHGLNRAIKNKQKWQAKYKRWCRTFNQQKASYIVKKAKEYECEKVIFTEMDTLITNWPWYCFAQCIENKCQEYGITFVKADNKAQEKLQESFLEKIDNE